jgi:hypothetical protein
MEPDKGGYNVREQIENAFSVLKISNAKKILFDVLNIEKNAVLGVAAEVVMVSLIMLVALALAVMLTLVIR